MVLEEEGLLTSLRVVELSYNGGGMRFDAERERERDVSRCLVILFLDGGSLRVRLI